MQFSEEFEGEQYLVISFEFHVETVHFNTTTGKLINRGLFKIASQLMDVKVHSKKIYVTTIDRKLYSFPIDLRPSTDLFKRKTLLPSMFIDIDSQYLISESRSSETKLSEVIRFIDEPDEIIWQSLEGYLMKNDVFLSYKLAEKIDWTCSYDEFKGQE